MARYCPLEPSLISHRGSLTFALLSLPEQLHGFNVSDVLEPILNQLPSFFNSVGDLAEELVVFEVDKVGVDERVPDVLVAQ